MKKKKMIIIFTCVLLILIAYLFSANYIFNVLIKTDKEARLANITLPSQTNDIKFAIDKIEILKLKWKDALLIQGWVFKENVRKEKREVYLALKSTNKTFIFKLEKNNINRPDVSAAYHLTGGIHHHGFEAYIPLYRLKEDAWQIGFVIEDETGKHYFSSNKSLRISNDSVLIGNYKPVPLPVSQQVPINIQGLVKDVSYNFDNVNKTGKYLTVQGWGFHKGMNTYLLKSYILLRNKESVAVFDADVQIRKDVTACFSKFKLNLDSSGFLARIPMGTLKTGKYRLGLYIVRGDQAAVVYSDKYVEIGN
jgi:hypothetical protein